MTHSNLQSKPSTTESEADSTGGVSTDCSVDIFADVPVAPLLENVIAAISLDARRDSLRYALRSNVGHDGE